MSVTTPRQEFTMTKLELEAQALALELELMSFDELGMPYVLLHQAVALFSIR
jgi:hypothetical protein